MNTDGEIIKGIERSLSLGEIEMFTPGITGHNYEQDLDAMDVEIERFDARTDELGTDNSTPLGVIEYRIMVSYAMEVQRERYAFEGGNRCTTAGCSNHTPARGVCHECRH